jgi:hypothetical protein
VKLSVVPNKPLKPIDFSEKIRMILIWDGEGTILNLKYFKFTKYKY